LAPCQLRLPIAWKAGSNGLVFPVERKANGSGGLGLGDAAGMTTTHRSPARVDRRRREDASEGGVSAAREMTPMNRHVRKRDSRSRRPSKRKAADGLVPNHTRGSRVVHFHKRLRRGMETSPPLLGKQTKMFPLNRASRRRLRGPTPPLT